jgi:oligosaccharide 4-alpha-D-glucosyltransferase
MASSFLSGAGRLALALLLGTAPACAQSPPARWPAHTQEVPGGQYKRCYFTNEALVVEATDGSKRRIQEWVAGVVKISYFAPSRQLRADSAVADASRRVVQPRGHDYVDVKLEQPMALAEALGIPWHKGLWEDAERVFFIVPARKTEGGESTGQALIINKKTLCISIANERGTVYSEASPAFWRQAAASASGQETGHADELAGTGIRFRLAPGERLYSLDARARPLDRSGYRLEFSDPSHPSAQNAEPNPSAPLPVVLSSRGYLLLFDHAAPGYLDLGKQHPDMLEYSAQGLSSLSYFVVTSNTLAKTLDYYTDLIGQPPPSSR